jgi:hypothetical protein
VHKATDCLSHHETPNEVAIQTLAVSTQTCELGAVITVSNRGEFARRLAERKTFRRPLDGRTCCDVQLIVELKHA